MMRYTVVDPTGTISFSGPPHGLKALAAGCSVGPPDHRSLIEAIAVYDERLSTFVLDGLAVFDERVNSASRDSVRAWLDDAECSADRPLRVVDELTRSISLEPKRLGVVIFNLIARRIVQVQNSYAEVLRKDRGRIRVDGRPTRRYFRYELPNEWQILP